MSYRDEQAKCATEPHPVDQCNVGGAAGYERVNHTVADLRIRQLALRDQIRIAQEKLTTVEFLLNVLQDGPCR